MLSQVIFLQTLTIEVTRGHVYKNEFRYLILFGCTNVSIFPVNMSSAPYQLEIIMITLIQINSPYNDEHLLVCNESTNSSIYK